MHQVFPFRIVWQYQKRKGCIAVSKLMIEGSHCLEGELTVHGAKNSALPVLSATLLCDGESHIHNCPRLSDVDASVEILRYLGCRVVREGDTVSVNTDTLCRCDIPDLLLREMRSSIVFLGRRLPDGKGEAFLSRRLRAGSQTH